MPLLTRKNGIYIARIDNGLFVQSFWPLQQIVTAYHVCSYPQVAIAYCTHENVQWRCVGQVCPWWI